MGTVICECPPALVRLLRTCDGIDRIIAVGESLPAFDVHAPLLSLPGILKTALDTIPSRIPYLHADATLNEAQARVLAHPGGFKMGIAWQGNRRTWNPDRHRPDRRRSIPLAHFESIARLPAVQLFSLQKGFGTEQMEELAGRFPIVDLGSTCEDFYDTATVMKKLDLVISVDSSPAHLAGGSGYPSGWLCRP